MINMNETIEAILNHRSVRQFQDKKLTKEQIETIVRCAQAASTSSFVQAYSIIGVTDQKKKQQLAQVAGNQKYVADNGHLFVFCADLHRYDIISKMENVNMEESIASTEKFMVALIDTALAAQNAAIAAESLGLGICYIGGLRNNLEKVCEILQTPKRVIPLFGLVVGYPEKINEQKPRLPLNHIYHENTYQQNEETYINQLNEYNKTIQDYYNKRTNGKRNDSWTGQVSATFAMKNRMYMHDFIKKHHLNK